jgi:hypothetical protein
MVEERFETSQQAAERLGIAVVTLCRWAREGRFPGAVKFARGWYIPRGAKPRRRGYGAVVGEFNYETTGQAARRLGVSVPHVIKLIECGYLQGERGPWRSYAIPRGALPLGAVLQELEVAL